MGVKITDMTPDAAVTGVEILPASDTGAPRRITTAQLSAFTIDNIEAIVAAVAVAATNKLLAIQAGVLVPVDIDLVTQRALDLLFDKAAASIADANLVTFEATGAQKVTTAALLAEYVRAAIENAILDISNLGNGTVAVTDYLLVTQTTTPKKITVQNLYDAIYTGLAAHVASRTDQPTPVDADLLYLVRSGAPFSVTLEKIAAFANDTATLKGSGTAAFLAKWANSNTLQAGPAIVTSFDIGSDYAIPTSKAVRDEMDAIVNDEDDIAVALTGTDALLVYDLSEAAQKKTDLSRVKTYLETAGVYRTLWVPAKAMAASTTNPATAEAIEYAVNHLTHDVMRFRGLTGDQNAEFDVVMPEAWDRSTVKAKVFWAPGDAAANPDEYVGFYLAGGAFSNDDANDAALGAEVLMADQAIADDDMHVSAASAALTVGGAPALGDLIHFKLRRDYDYAGGGAAMDVDARVFGVLIQYRENLEVAAW